MPTGRPRVLNEAKQREVCALVSAGCGIQEAAQYVGCAGNTIRREARRNGAFQERLREARTFAQLSALRAMRRAAARHWRAAAWMLERGDPDHFARRSPHAFRPKQARALVRDLLHILQTEIHDPLLLHRIEDRARAVLRYAIHDVQDTVRTGPDLRRAMRYLESIQRGDEAFDPLGLPYPAEHELSDDSWPGTEGRSAVDGNQDVDAAADDEADHRPATNADLAHAIRSMIEKLRAARDECEAASQAPAAPELPPDHPAANAAPSAQPTPAPEAQSS